MSDASTPTPLRGPYGIPFTTEPQTGYITRGNTTYAVDHIHMTLAEAFRRGINFFDPGYKVGDDLSGWVWSAQIDDGPIAYAPFREAAIDAAKPPPRRERLAVARCAAGHPHELPIGYAARDAGRGQTIVIADRGVFRGEMVAFASGKEGLSPEERRDIILDTPRPTVAPTPNPFWGEPPMVDTSDWPKRIAIDPGAKPERDAKTSAAPTDTGLAGVLSTARLSAIQEALAKSKKVTASHGDEELYAALTAAWADAHPNGRVIIAAKRKTLDRLFIGHPKTGDAMLCTIGRCDTWVDGETNDYTGVVRPHSTRVDGVRLRRSTSPEHFAGFSHEDQLIIVTRPVTPEQLLALEGNAVGGTHIVLFGTPTAGRHGIPNRWWTPAL